MMWLAAIEMAIAPRIIVSKEINDKNERMRFSASRNSGRATSKVSRLCPF